MANAQHSDKAAMPHRSIQMMEASHKFLKSSCSQRQERSIQLSGMTTPSRKVTARAARETTASA